MKKEMKDISEETIPRARGKKTQETDFDRNRDGLYGGLPKMRAPAAAGAPTWAPHPESGHASRTRRGQ
jgi:hypothetical protein